MQLSKIMLGTVQFGLNYGVANTKGKPSCEQVRDIVATAYEGGVRTFDTAAAYGDSEIVLGKVLEDLGLKSNVEIVSKVPKLPEDKQSSQCAYDHFSFHVENSLTRLGIDQLPVCLIHNEDDFRFIDQLERLVDRNLIGSAGISLDSEKYCQDVLSHGVKYVQLPLNILDHRFDDFNRRCEKEGITVFVRSVYLQGLLLMNEEKIPSYLQEIIPVRRKLADIATKNGFDFAELCFRYVLSVDGVSSVLTGVDTVEQLRQNIGLANKGPLSKELVEQLKDVVPAFEERILRPMMWT